jgi:UPF0716 protein FxsA
MTRRAWLGWVVLIAFVALFTLESWLFLEIGSRVGLFFTLAWIFFSFLLGMVLIRLEGLRMLFQIHLQLQRGVLPAQEMLNGLAVVLGGLLLMLPGYFTDMVGLLLLFPPMRGLMLYCVGRSLAHWMTGGAEPACGVRPSEEVMEIRAQRVEKDSQPA